MFAQQDALEIKGLDASQKRKNQSYADPECGSFKLLIVCLNSNIQFFINPILRSRPALSPRGKATVKQTGGRTSRPSDSTVCLTPVRDRGQAAIDQYVTGSRAFALVDQVSGDLIRVHAITSSLGTMPQRPRSDRKTERRGSLM